MARTPRVASAAAVYAAPVPDTPAGPAPLVVMIRGADRRLLVGVSEAASTARGRVEGAVGLAQSLGAQVPTPGHGRTAEYLAVLATIGSVDLTVARVVEPHLDALAILDQAAQAPGDGVYGVYAAERPGVPPVQAESTGDGFTLSGTKPWCSLAGRLDRALITAVEEGERRLFDIDLRHPGAAAVEGTWVSRGLAAVESGDLALQMVPATPVGAAGWYLTRPGFAWGGIGVAACWYGGAVGVASALLRSAAQRPPDPFALAAIGEADRLQWAARCVLDDAAAQIDRGAAVGAEGALLASRVRGVVAHAAERILTLVGHALGPAPLTFDEDHARRVADLTVYLRQHHAARDDAREGEAVLASEAAWA